MIISQLYQPIFQIGMRELHLAGKWDCEKIDDAYAIFKELASNVCPSRKTILKTGKCAIRKSPKRLKLETELFRIFNIYKMKNIDNKIIRLLPDYVYVKKMLKKEVQKNIRSNWTSKIDNMAIQQRMDWNIISMYHNIDKTIPRSLPPDDFALHFLKLSYDYTPKNMCLSEIEIQPNDISKFSFFLPITPGGSNPITSLEMIYKNHKNSKFSTGYDGISLNLLTLMGQLHWTMLAKLVTTLLENGTYMKDFREVRCIPLHKKGDKNNVINYRPLSICSSLANVLEKVMSVQISSFAETKNKLHPDMIGFRAGHNVGQMVNSVRQEVFDNDHDFGIITLTDLKNAYGATDMPIIMSKMQKFFNNDALKSIRSFLIQPTIKIEVEGKKSNPFDGADRGYGQGSCLSCILFILLMTEAHDLTLNSRNYSYADDNQIISTGDDEEEVIKEANDAAQAFAGFCNNLNINVNYTKSFFTILKLKRNKSDTIIKIKMDGNEIPEKNIMNMLGINLNNELNFTPHEAHITSAMRKYNGFISGMLKYTGPKSISLLTKSLMNGKLSHGLSYMMLFKNQLYKQWQFQANKLLNKKFATKKEKSLLKRFQLLPQFIILYRSFSLSFQNLHRMTHMTRMNKILITAYPRWEFEKLIACFYQPNYGKTRSQEVIPFFKPSRHGIFENKKTITTMPMAWATEFNRLPQKIRSTIGSKYFLNNIKVYYKNRCQHQEHTLALCEGCGNSTDLYQNDQKMINHNKIWEKSNVEETKDFAVRVDNWYEGKESGKKIMMYLEEKDINNEHHDSKLHEWLKKVGWKLCRIRRNKKAMKIKFKKLGRSSSLNKNTENLKNEIR
jgi:hypothetical protein